MLSLLRVSPEVETPLTARKLLTLLALAFVSGGARNLLRLARNLYYPPFPVLLV
ncbi:MAG: hypothetical protein INR62_06110 [Rhodospirillales bacterium]|nr:hypothetical protein [Acetobacter sp.]